MNKNERINKLSFEDTQILVEQAPIMIWRSNQEKLCDYFNERWLKFTGRTFEQEYGNGWAEGVHPEDFNRCLEIYTTNFDKQSIFEMRYRLKRHDGVYRWIFDRGVPFYRNEMFGGYIGSCIDIHEQVLAEMEMERMQNEKIKKLESLLPVCAWCKKIRVKETSTRQRWVTIEQFFEDPSATSVTHTICEECSEKTKNKF